MPDGPRAPAGLPPGRLGQPLDRARQQPRFLVRVVERRDVFVTPAEHADLVPLAFGDLRHHLRIDEIRDAGNEERRRHVVPVEQVEHARQALRGAEFAAGHRDHRRVAARELVRRVADVEGEGDGNAGAVRPGFRVSERPARTWLELSRNCASVHLRPGWLSGRLLRSAPARGAGRPGGRRWRSRRVPSVVMAPPLTAARSAP